MQKVLVTGAAGFIGGHLCEALARQGFEVLAFAHPDADVPWLKHPRIRTFTGDVTQPATLEQPVREADVVIHAAARVKGRDLAEFLVVNCDGTRNLLSRMAQTGRPCRFVLLSSVAAGGPGETGKPVSLYGESKLAAERVTEEFADRLPVATLRMPPVFGPRDRAMLAIFQMINRGFRPVLGITLSTCFVADAVEAALQLAGLSSGPRSNSPDSLSLPVGPYTVCDGPPHTFDELTQEIMAALGSRAVRVRIPRGVVAFLGAWAERFSPDVPAFNRDKALEFVCTPWTCTNSALNAATGFEPKYDLETALRLTIDWYRENRWL